MNVLGNVLSKDLAFQKVGHAQRGGFYRGSYKVSVWALKRKPDLADTD